MTEADVLIGPGKDGDFMASFEKAKSDTGDPMSEELPSTINDISADPDSSAFPDARECQTEAAVLTSTPVLHRGVCFDTTTGEDTMPLVQSDSLLENPSEGVDGDLEVESEESYQYDDDDSQEGDQHRDISLMRHVMSLDHSRESLMVPGTLKVPIVGYETMEARSRFTIYKIHVMMGEDDPGWFVFRRYSDFVHLNDQLRELFPNMRLALPPKRWFRSNFDPDFLQERKVGLQDFLENVTGHRDILSSQPVRDFFCFDDPPSIHDSLEESRAQCECLEELTHLLRKELGEKEIEMDLLKEEIDLYKNQVRLLTERLSEFNKSMCLQEKASLEGRNTSSSLSPNMRMRSLNMRNSVTDMEKSAPDLKISGSELSRLAPDGSNCESDSKAPHSSLHKLSLDLKTSTPVKRNAELGESPVSDPQGESVTPKLDISATDTGILEKDLSSTCGHHSQDELSENAVLSSKNQAEGGGQEISSPFPEADSGGNAVQDDVEDEMESGREKA